MIDNNTVPLTGHYPSRKEISLFDLEYDIEIHEDKADYLINLASKYGKSDAVEILLENGANYNSTFAFGWACRNGHSRVVELLLDAGYDIKNDDGYALLWACENNHESIVEILIETTCDLHIYNNLALRNASEKGFFCIVNLLLESGSKLETNNFEAIQMASANYHDETIFTILYNIFKTYNKEDAEKIAKTYIGKEYLPMLEHFLVNEYQEMESTPKQIAC